MKGKIFIEAFGERDIVYAISGMSNVNPNSIQLIPINERMKVFDFDKYQKVDINNNQLVRIKQGNYEGDLAKVVYIEDPINKIYVSLVPRIYESTKNSSDFNVAQFSIKRTKIRPRQKLFNKKYGNNITTIHEVYGDCIKYGKFKFKDNLLIKPVRITSLETENIYPKEEEMQQLGCYKDENGVYVDKEGQKLIVSNSQSIQYKNGDKIKFTTGEYKGITGTVISQIGNKVKVNLDIKDLSEDYEFPVNMIELDYNFKPEIMKKQKSRQRSLQRKKRNSYKYNG